MTAFRFAAVSVVLRLLQNQNGSFVSLDDAGVIDPQRYALLRFHDPNYLRETLQKSLFLSNLVIGTNSASQGSCKRRARSRLWGMMTETTVSVPRTTESKGATNEDLGN